MDNIEEKIKKLREENSDFKNTIVEAEKTLAQEIKSVVNNADIFDLTNFAVQFDEHKDNISDLQKFLQDYLEVQENDEKAIAASYQGDSRKFNYMLNEN